MTGPSDDATPREATVEVLRAIWSTEGTEALDDDCGPTKACRNMAHVSFDGFAEPGTDLRSAWRERLEREGKLGAAGQSVRDLVLGDS